MIGRSFFLFSFLQAVMSGQWIADTPPDVTAQNGLCARIPCHYRYPSYLNNEPRTGIWYNSETNNEDSVAFHSGDPSLESTIFHHRTRLSGVLRDSDCSLVIDNVTQQDAGPYFFRVYFGGGYRYNYHPVTELRVIDFTDQPTIFPAEMVAGQPVNVTCSFKTTCNGTDPTLTWVNPADEPPSASRSVTQRGDTRKYTSVLSLTPALKHHGQNLTCRVTYPTVSSEQNLTLTVQYAPRNPSITSHDDANSSRISLKERNSAAILCSVQSFPTSNLTWGHLQCVAENEHGTAERDVTLTVEYAPEISWDSGCTRTSEIINCVCAARCNPPAELTWLLPLANLNGNQTRGRFQTWQVASGHLVNSSLTLTGGDGWEDVTALCSVRNRHGEALLTVYLSMEEQGDQN
ncbi:myelin-associated glycoprotein-like [Amblyraja radiata]|uniref:myelin-associated glycoprotein-like n=1 Tax=Amblyraja radiata TaxID=386614 RepID=UPI00140379CF|nr:myelin-associated glycoprotein-like [Amblyraja radiata]